VPCRAQKLNDTHAAPVAAFALRSVERIAQALWHPQEGNQVADAVRVVIERITPTPGATVLSLN
jgi:hypothetical protein